MKFRTKPCEIEAVQWEGHNLDEIIKFTNGLEKHIIRVEGLEPVIFISTLEGGMMAKHTVSVYDLIDDYEQGKAISKEMWAEKIGDSINYLLLLTALLEEDKNFEPMKREMTYEQTIEVITNAIQKDEMTVERDMALAIVQKTLKKQIPKKIEFDGNQLICPNCGNGTDILFGDKYCVECGQHLDWSWAIQ